MPTIGLVQHDVEAVGESSSRHEKLCLERSRGYCRIRLQDEAAQWLLELHELAGLDLGSYLSLVKGGAYALDEGSLTLHPSPLTLGKRISALHCSCWIVRQAAEDRDSARSQRPCEMGIGPYARHVRSRKLEEWKPHARFSISAPTETGCPRWSNQTRIHLATTCDRDQPCDIRGDSRRPVLLSPDILPTSTGRVLLINHLSDWWARRQWEKGRLGAIAF
jgi:hypothetical protein